MSAGAGRPGFGRRFAALFAAGLLGGQSLAPTLSDMLRSAPIPPGALAAAPLPVPVALSLIQPALLMAGVAFGWLFWHRSLEAAMLAHMAAHVVFTLASLAGA